MPQVRCPNCGATINLETRKETDFNLIINALHKNPKTFTQLLTQTRLPRKTLSLRLKELCDRGVIVKDGGYHLSETYPIKNLWGEKMSALYGDMKNSILSTRKGAFLLLLLLCVGLPVAVKAYQMLLPQAQETSLKQQSPQYIGTVSYALNIYNVVGLHHWEASIHFDPEDLGVLECVEGDFLKKAPNLNDPPTYFCNASDDPKHPDILLLGDTLVGEIAISGDGTLAIITFGIKHEDYKPPQLGEYYFINLDDEEISATLELSRIDT
ncbi:MAG: hypothetical protein QXN63_01235 [Candidatus Bathyarchaeia archaeon]